MTGDRLESDGRTDGTDATKSEPGTEQVSSAGTTVTTVSPSTKVPVLKLGLVGGVALASIAVLGAFLADVVTFGTGLDGAIVLACTLGLLLCAMAILNLLVQIVVLRRTTYRIEDDSLHKRFEMLYRTSEREIPIDRLRGIEFSQNALQNVFDYGTLLFLTAGPNRSLGFLSFEYVPDPERYREAIRSRMSGDDE